METCRGKALKSQDLGRGGGGKRGPSWPGLSVQGVGTPRGAGKAGPLLSWLLGAGASRWNSGRDYVRRLWTGGAGARSALKGCSSQPPITPLSLPRGSPKPAAPAAQSSRTALRGDPRSTPNVRLGAFELLRTDPCALGDPPPGRSPASNLRSVFVSASGTLSPFPCGPHQWG